MPMKTPQPGMDHLLLVHPTALPSGYLGPRGGQRVFWGGLGSWGWGWEGDGDVWSKLLPPAVTHSALIAPCWRRRIGDVTL